jgi:hypothetical protein
MTYKYTDVLILLIGSVFLTIQSSQVEYDELFRSLFGVDNGQVNK